MLTEASLGKLAGLGPNENNSGPWLELVLSSQTYQELYEGIEINGWSVDCYQLLRPIFLQVMSKPQGFNMVKQIVSESVFAEYFQDVMYYLTQMGEQPYVSLQFLANKPASYFVDPIPEHRKKFFTHWSNTVRLRALMSEEPELVKQEGALIMLHVLQRYFAPAEVVQ